VLLDAEADAVAADALPVFFPPALPDPVLAWPTTEYVPAGDLPLSL
jgi:hypothetical protein